MKLSHKQFEKLVRRFANETAELVIKKNKDYAPSSDSLRNFRHGGERSIAYRMVEKATRLANLLERRKRHNFEGVSDTVQDLAGYVYLFQVYASAQKEIR